MSKTTLVAALVTTAALAGGVVAPAAADAIADFYRGRTVTIMVPSGLGATLGLYGRLVSEHLVKHIPGNPNLILASRPGGGGTKGASYAYNAAPKDGTFIAEVLSASVLSGKLRKFKFDAAKFQWIGSVTPRPIVVTAWHTAPATTLAGAKRTEVILGSTGLGSETYLAPALMNALLGTKFKIVKGYKGGAALNKAMEQGETQGRMNYWSGWTAGKPNWVRDNKLRHFVQYGTFIKELPNVPQFKNLVNTDLERQMLTFMEASPKVGMGFWVAPGVAADKVKALRTAFMATMRDPAFLADAKKRRAPVDPITGEEPQRIVAEAYKTPDHVIRALKQRLGFAK